jgi:hypothetical protein
MFTLLTGSLAVVLFACSLTQALSNVVLSTEAGVVISTTDTDPTNLDTNTVYTVSFTADSTDTDPTLHNTWDSFLCGYVNEDPPYQPFCLLGSGTFATTSYQFSLYVHVRPLHLDAWNYHFLPSQHIPKFLLFCPSHYLPKRLEIANNLPLDHLAQPTSAPPAPTISRSRDIQMARRTTTPTRGELGSRLSTASAPSLLQS